jgi:hypothetical protein
MPSRSLTRDSLFGLANVRRAEVMQGPCEQLVHLVAELRTFFVFANRDSHETNRLPLVSCCSCSSVSV